MYTVTVVTVGVKLADSISHVPLPLDASPT
jgi:hypothetical protein